MAAQEAPDLAALPWRTGPSGLVVYAETRQGVRRVGTMETQELAAEAVEAHNSRLAVIMRRRRLRAESLGTAAGETR